MKLPPLYTYLLAFKQALLRTKSLARYKSNALQKRGKARSESGALQAVTSTDEKSLMMLYSSGQKKTIE